MYNLVVMENFGQWLRRCRKNLGWSQDKLADESGISASYISTLERNQPHSITGAVLRPEPDKVKKLAKALNTDIDEALLLAGYAPTNDQGESKEFGDVRVQLLSGQNYSEKQKEEFFKDVEIALEIAKRRLEEGR